MCFSISTQINVTHQFQSDDQWQIFNIVLHPNNVVSLLRQPRKQLFSLQSLRTVLTDLSNTGVGENLLWYHCCISAFRTIKLYQKYTSPSPGLTHCFAVHCWHPHITRFCYRAYPDEISWLKSCLLLSVLEAGTVWFRRCSEKGKTYILWNVCSVKQFGKYIFVCFELSIGCIGWECYHERNIYVFILYHSVVCIITIAFWCCLLGLCGPK